MENRVFTIVYTSTGKEAYAITSEKENFIDVEVEEGFTVIPELRTVNMNNPYFNFETREFYDKPE